MNGRGSLLLRHDSARHFPNPTALSAPSALPHRPSPLGPHCPIRNPLTSAPLRSPPLPSPRGQQPPAPSPPRPLAPQPAAPGLRPRPASPQLGAPFIRPAFRTLPPRPGELTEVGIAQPRSLQWLLGAARRGWEADLRSRKRPRGEKGIALPAKSWSTRSTGQPLARGVCSSGVPGR
jgi:hypothetical protein